MMLFGFFDEYMNIVSVFFFDSLMVSCLELMAVFVNVIITALVLFFAFR